MTWALPQLGVSGENVRASVHVGANEAIAPAKL